jgi:hypothetical protein
MADGITRIAVEGFKSIAKRQEIEIAPLTILAGANSSGKSSIMQPLLMLKQTLEATYDPGPLKIDGPNVTFTSISQFLSRRPTSLGPRFLRVEIMAGGFGLELSLVGRDTLEIFEETYCTPAARTTLRPEMSDEELKRLISAPRRRKADSPFISRDRFFLTILDGVIGLTIVPSQQLPDIQGVVHVPGLRGDTSRTYRRTATGPHFPGTFEHYVASLILQWQSGNEAEYLLLNRDLAHVGLAGKVVAKKLNDVELDLRVNRLADPESEDLVSVADVGFGVSQTLPLLVALRAAEPGRLVYLEEPEIHLHPRAQTKLADILAGAANRGVRVVVETHSTLLLTAIQTLVAKGELSPDLVKLHWFQRDPKTGITQVNSTGVDGNGAFREDWPEDFDEVILDTDRQYLDAVTERSTG